MEQEGEATRRLWHHLRAACQHLQLCTDALSVETSVPEKLYWLEQIERSADRCDAAAAAVETAEG